LRTWQGLADIWLKPGATLQYYPLTHTSWWVQYHLWGLAPLGYHLVNVLLHGVSAGVLWLVLRRLRVPGAWMAAAVFALHPVHVESVAWVTELKNVQSGLFYLLALLAALAAADESRPRAGRGARYALTLGLFVCALLSKTVTGTLPAVIALVLWWQRGRIGWRELAALVPFGVLGLAAGALTAWMEMRYVGASGAAWALSPAARVLVAGRALWFYAAKLVWPTDLAFVYPRWTIDPGVWWQWLFPFGACVAVGLLVIGRRRLGRGPLVAVLYFAGTLVPALGFFDLYPMRYTFVADHFQYLASIGPIGLLVAVAAVPLARRPRALRPLAGTLLVVLGVLVWRQAEIYRSAETLWRDTLARNPSAWIAHNNLGLVLMGEGKLGEAGEHIREALRLARNLWEVHNNLGRVLLQEGRLAEAGEQFRKALRLARDPSVKKASVALVHNNLGLVLFDEGRLTEAGEHFQEAVRLWPEYPDALYNLGNVLAMQGKPAEAEADFEQVLRLDELHAAAHNSLGNVLVMQGRREEGIRHYRRALELSPDYADARRNLDLVGAQ